MRNFDPALLIGVASAVFFGIVVLALILQLRGRSAAIASAEAKLAELNSFIEALRERLGTAERDGARAAAQAEYLVPATAQADGG